MNAILKRTFPGRAGTPGPEHKELLPMVFDNAVEAEQARAEAYPNNDNETFEVVAVRYILH